MRDGSREGKGGSEHDCRGKDNAGGMEESNPFHEKREACIRRKYDADED